VGRLFTNDGSVNDFIRVESTGLTAFPYGTIAAVIRITAIDPTNGRNIFLIGTDAQDFVELFVADGSAGSAGHHGGPAIYMGVSSGYSTATPTAGTWLLMAATKDTGNVATRVHVYSWPLNTWSHLTGIATGGGANTQADSTGTGSTANGIGFTNAGNEAFSPNADILCSAGWVNRAMGDSEIERLASGMWSRWAPDLYMCFPSGRDSPARTSVDGSRNRVRQTSVGSQVTRTNAAGPPGFRIEPFFRRR
jgi:hypothetical protein